MSTQEPNYGNMPVEVEVAIVGGGIGGLAAAVALRKVGIIAQVYEQAEALGVVGGAVIIREPSVRLFESWGVAGGFMREAVRFDVIEVRGSDGKVTGTSSADPSGDGNAYSVHRADVHARLLAGVDPANVHLGMKSVEVFEDGERGIVRFENGAEIRARVLVGADGIKSVARKVIHDDEMIFSKLVVMRGLAPSSALPDNVPNDRLYLWGGGDEGGGDQGGGDQRRMTLLPLRGGTELAMDTIMMRDTPPKDLWTSEVPTSELLDFFQGFDPAIIHLIQAGTVPVKANPVYEREPIDHWSTRHITLLGDAAHAMAPRMGQGANMAIQDADALARALSGAGMSDIPTALRRYEEERAPITKKMQIASRNTPEVRPLAKA